ncbi:hypothetical protein P8452_55320 [Trifolium repens]|nr:hypothetical protein P8452_55320 [Trifolium repens]
MSTSSRRRHYRQPSQPPQPLPQLPPQDQQPQPPHQLPPQHQQPQPPTQPPLPTQPQPQPQPQPPPLPQPPQPHHSHWIVDVIVPTTKKDLVYETNIKAKFVVNDQDHRKFRCAYLETFYQSYHSIQSEHMHSHVCFPAMLETTAAVHPGASGGAVLKRLHTRQFKYSFCLIGHMIEHLIFLYSLVV